MNIDLAIMTVLVGLGTWLMRFGPTKISLFNGKPGGAMSRFLSATGPAAIAALFAAAFLPIATLDISVVLPMAVGAGAVVAGFALTRDIAAGAIAGALGYGAAAWLMGI